MHGTIDAGKRPVPGEVPPTHLGVMPLLLLVCIIILTGTYFRSREEAEGPSADWLVWAQLITCSLGGIWGLGQIVKTRQLGIGANVLFLYFLGCGVSCLFSPFGVIAFGYWILLVGSGLLMIGLVGKARSEHDLERILNLWLVVVAVLLLKDTILSFIVPDTRSGGFDEQAFRVGSSTVAPLTISITAALAFGLTLKKDELLRPLYLWLPRFFFLLVILLSRSRTPLIALIGGLFAWFLYRQFSGGGKRWTIGLALPSLFFAVIILWVFLLLERSEWALNAYEFLNRGQQQANVTSLTGRTQIWKYGVERVFDSPTTIIFGHGYGVTRMVFMEGQQEITFSAQHAHNGPLEALLGSGLFGAIPFIFLLILSGVWIFRFQDLRRAFSLSFLLRAVFVISVVYISSTAEAFLATKPGPRTILFFLFVLAADKFRYFMSGKDLSHSNSMSLDRSIVN